MRQRLHLLALPFVLAAAVVAGAAMSGLPIPVRGGQIVVAKVTPTGDIDSYGLFLGTGDALTVSVRNSAPTYGLNNTLSLADPVGADVTPAVKGQATRKTSFTFTAAKTGVHVLTLTGDVTGLAGSTGDYTLTFTIKHAKIATATYSDAAGGAISTSFETPAGSSATVSASTKKGGFDLTDLLRPDGTAEPGFAARLKTKNRRSASVSKFPLTGGDGTYQVRGNYDSGSKVTLKVAVVRSEKKATKRFAEEPVFDVDSPLIPAQGITGTAIKVAGTNLDDIPVLDNAGNVVGHRYPSFSIGGIAVPAATVTHPYGTIYQFPVPAGLAPNQSHDVAAVDADGQGVIVTDAFFLVPPPRVASFSVGTAGPAGGRHVRINGQDFRPNSVVLFDSKIVQPIPPVRSTYIDVVAPPHAHGSVAVAVRDAYGQVGTAPSLFTYLDIGSNRIFSVNPPMLLAAGGQSVVVNGADFGADTVLTFDDVVMTVARPSSSVLTFTSPEHLDATVKLRVTDQYEQTSAVDVRLKGFADVTTTTIPAPVTTSGSADAWRAGRVLVGDVDGDGYSDIVLLRAAAASGTDVNRPRLRVLLSDRNGGFTDATSSKVPGISGDEDWRAKDGVLVDIDGDGDLDLAIITDGQVSGGARSSLRILKNDGSGAFTDFTTSGAPALTNYGDVNQGVAIAAARLDAGGSYDLVITDTSYITQTVIIPDPNPPLPPGIPNPTILHYYYPGTRVLTNSGNGVFTRKTDAIPAITPSSRTQYQGDAVVVGDVNGDSKPDIVVTRRDAAVDPANAGAFVLTASLLTNDGSAVFTDVSTSKLPAAGDPEYLQGDRLYLADLDGDNDLDLVVASVIRVVSPVTSQLATTPALRMFANDGSGHFIAMTNVLPGTDQQDQLQSNALAIGDLSGDGRPDIFVVSTRAPNSGENGGRLLMNVGGAWAPGAKGLPSPLVGDDLRGADTALVDVDRDGALDLVIVREESDETVRNTLIVKNPFKDFVNTTPASVPAPVTTTGAVDGWRAARVLVGDVTGDGAPDLVLLRPEKASGPDASRPRVRVLRGDSAGGFVDATATSIPAVAGDEDWRAKDGVLVDVDGDGDLDLVIITDDPVSGGARSGMRILRNGGGGVFADVTSTAAPAARSYGDRNQGVAIGAARRDVPVGTNTKIVYDLVIVHTGFFTDNSGGSPAYHPGTRVLVNDGAGVFSFKTNALPAVTPTSATQYQGVSVAVGDVNGDGFADIVVTKSQPAADLLNAGAFVRATSLLTSDGTNTFTDVSAANLPAKSDPEYLQGDRVQLVDLSSDGRPDIVLSSAARIVSPITAQTATTPALRILSNNGSGVFTAMTGTMPGADGQDYLQADGVAAGDVYGQGNYEFVLVSAHAPNTGKRGGRLLVKSGTSWASGSTAFPDVPGADDLRGVDVAVVDVDRDGDADIVIVRDEADDTVRNTVVLRSRRK